MAVLKQHLTKCPFALIPCPKQCKDDKGKVRQVKKDDLVSHLAECPNRDYKCQYCGEKGLKLAETQKHFDKCKKFVVPCTNDGCSKTIQRQGLRKHIECCPYTEVPCKYAKLGCDVRMKRKDIATHEEQDDKRHLHNALDTLAAMEEKMGAVYSGESVTFKLTDYRKKCSNSEMMKSSFYAPNGCHMTITMYPNGHESGKYSHVTVLINSHSQHGETSKAFNGTVTIDLLNQLEDKNHHMWSGKKSSVNLIRHSMLEHDQKRNVQYLKDDTLYFRVTMDIPNHKPWLECKNK